MHAAVSRSGILHARPAKEAFLLALSVTLAPLAGCMDSSISLLPGLADAGQGGEDPRCHSDAECDERAPICNPQTRACVECIGDDDCGGDRPQVCLVTRGECVQCSSDDQCTSAEPYCDPESNYCEECLADEHCAAGQICDLEDERCVER